MMRKWPMILIVALSLLLMVGVSTVSAKKVITFSGVYAQGEAAVDVQYKFKELLEKRSKGEFEVRVIIGMAMGGERDHIEAAQTGALELIAMGNGDTNIFAPELSLDQIPFLIQNDNHFWAFWNSEVGKEVNERVRKKVGVRTLAILNRGPRYLTANKPIRSLKDLKGVRLRLPEVEPWIRIWKALGTSPIPIAFNEVYQALQTGIADAQENPIMSIYALKFYEVQKYIMATRHIYSVAKFQASERWWQTLTPAEQKLIEQCMKEAAEYGNKLTKQREEEQLKEMLARGVKFIEQSDMDMEGIRKVVQKTVEQMVAEGVYDAELYKKTLKLLQ